MNVTFGFCHRVICVDIFQSALVVGDRKSQNWIFNKRKACIFTLDLPVEGIHRRRAKKMDSSTSLWI